MSNDKVGRPSLAARRLKAGIAYRATGLCRLTPAGRPGTATPLKIEAFRDIFTCSQGRRGVIDVFHAAARHDR
jgi:hypothetical protein